MSSLLQQKDQRYVWHPFTQHLQEPITPVILRAKGTSLFDEQGNEILDLISSWWTCTHGHSHPQLNKAIAEQAGTLEHVLFAGYTHPQAIALAEKLADVLPGDLSRTFFSDNGSTAVEVALKLAYQFHRNQGEHERTKFLAFEGGYHGDTVGAMAVGRGSGFFGVYEDLLFEVEQLPYPSTWIGDTEIEAKERAALEGLDRVLEEQGKTIAGLIIEPLIQGASGMRVCRPEFVREVTLRAQAAGVPVIFDEVAVGFGRTGTLFACEQVGVEPDFICLSKGLTAGYMPMSVTVTTERVFEAFLADDFAKAFLHGHSFTANPLACAVAVRSLELFEEEGTLNKIEYIQLQHQRFIPQLLAHPAVRRGRTMGSMLAFELAHETGGYKSETSEMLRKHFMNKHLNIRPLGGTFYLMPPYCVSEEELKRGYAGILEAMDQLLPSLA